MLNKRHKSEELPDEVRMVYNEVESILLREEEAHRRDKRKIPGDRLEYPSIMVPPPPPPPPPLRKHVELLIEKAEILTKSLKGRDQTIEEIMEDVVDEAMYDVRRITEEAMENFGEEPIYGTGEETPKNTMPDTRPTNEPTEAFELGTIQCEEAQQRAVQDTEATEDSWEDDSDAEVTGSRLAPYKKAKLHCMECNTNHMNEKLLMKHMLKNHLTELSSTSWRCCTDQVWNASLTSYVSHWGGVHGFRKEPFPCPKCNNNFRNIPDIRRHWLKIHKKSVKRAKNARSTTPKIQDVPKPQSLVVQTRKGSGHSTLPTSVVSTPQNHVGP